VGIALGVRGLSKHFASTRALDHVDIDVARGEVHALMGANGSGKSTLIKTLSGFVQPDPGATAHVEGEALELGDAAAAFRRGLRFVHQDLGLVDELDAIDNFALGHGYVRRRGGAIDWKRSRYQAESALAGLGLSIDVRIPVGRLSASSRTAVAVSRAMAGWEQGHVTVLVLDEPTASMPDDEVARLFDAIRAVRARGVAVIYVSHHLDEVFEIADRVTVLRDGRRVDTVPTASLNHDALITLMIGGTFAPHVAATSATNDSSPVVLRATHVSTSLLDEFSVDVRAGEVVGVAGLAGSGREHVAKALFGAIPRIGVVEVDGEPVSPAPGAAIRSGLSMVPAERAREGLVLSKSARENVSLPRVSAFRRRGRVCRRAETDDARHWLAQTNVRPADQPERIVATFSGGNQQKVLLARWLGMQPRVLILDEPTQGVDVAAKTDIYGVLREAVVDRGVALLVCSTDSPELASLCDRVIVLANGRIHCELLAPVTDEDIERACLVGSMQGLVS
jgi:ribose transport system ATP-binding protein